MLTQETYLENLTDHKPFGGGEPRIFDLMVHLFVNEI